MKKVFHMKGKTIEEIDILYNKIFNYFAGSERLFSVSMRLSTQDSFIDKYIYEVWGYGHSYHGLEDFYEGKNFIGQDSNSIGPNGMSNFWEYDEDGNVVPTTPEPENTIFIDGCYDVIVVR